jgi:hypothetical protein
MAVTVIQPPCLQMASAPSAGDVAKAALHLVAFYIWSQKQMVSLDRRPFGGNAGTRSFFEKLAQL